jgi:phosphoribosylglycinamide formyltransferase 1
VKNKPNLALLASGFGSNLQVILDEVSKGNLDATVRVVLSDKQNSQSLVRAKKAGVEAVHASPKQFESREKYDAHLVALLKERDIDWVVLAGFMRILSPVFVRAFQQRIVNIHPALLPKYPGTQAIERAFEAREKEIGVTVHYVDEGVDTGPIILQEKILISEGETLDEVTRKVHELEHRIYPEALRRVIGPF